MPVLVMVWTAVPWLPCCQPANAYVGADHDFATFAAETTAAITTDDTEHCPDSESEGSTPECSDTITNGNETRPVTSSAAYVALVAFAYVVPLVPSVADNPQPIRVSPRPRRSLHLEKSVLLI